MNAAFRWCPILRSSWPVRRSTNPDRSGFRERQHETNLGNHQRFRVAALLSLSLFVLVANATAQQPLSTASAEGERGIQLYNQGNVKEAISQLQAALRENKDDSTSWFYLGLCLTRDGQFKEASKAYEIAKRLRPDWASAQAGLAYTLLLRNKLKEAQSEAEHALTIDSGLADAHYTIGVIHLRNGNNAGALAEADAAIRRNPEYAQAYLLKSQALVSFFQGTELPPTGESKDNRLARYKEAAESLEKYLKLSPGSGSEETWREQLEALQFSVTMLEKAGNARTTFQPQEVTTRTRVLKKPEPSYTEQARQNQVRGTVILRAVFDADGQVKHIIVVRGLPDGLTERSIAAARAIKFIPAMKDGKPVSMWIQLEYNFNVF
jgi:TonB family protein